MTSNELLNSLRNLIEKRREFVSDAELEEIYKEYKVKTPSKIVSPIWHKVISQRAGALARAVIVKGGTKEEVKLALTYMLVCLDAEKQKLDYARFKQENGVVELSEKYGVKTN